MQHARIILLGMALVFGTWQVLAQKPCTKYKTKKGRLSGIECWTDAQRGYALVFGPKGDTSAYFQLSKMHQLAGVNFDFHADGSIAKAEYHSHPDAGIQWYRSYTWFDEQGNRTNFSEERHDDRPSLLHFEPERQDTMPKRIIWVEPKSKPTWKTSEYQVVNHSSKRIRFSWTIASGTPRKGKLKPGQKLRLLLDSAQAKFPEPMIEFTIEKKGVCNKAIKLNMNPYLQQINPNYRIVLFEWTKSK